MPFSAARSARVLVGASLVTLLACGCIGARVIYPIMPTGEELRAFEAAGPADLQADVLTPASMQVSGPYRVGPGDLLAFELPPTVQPEVKTGETTAAAPLSVTIKCRVKDDGTVLLPMLGTYAAAAKTPGEIEKEVALEYAKPERLKLTPNVVVTISEYKTVNVVVIGAVNQPGSHELKTNQLSVVGALSAAGGIKSERGARQILVLGTDEQGQPVTHKLDVMLDDIPLADLALKGGETIVIEPPPDRSFTVYGLVKKSGIFEYPAPRRFNLMQALATAGGVDENAAPRYASIYRKRPDGTILGATFKIDGTDLENASNIFIKDGDVIAVDHTQGSWLRQFFSQVFGFRASVNVSSTASPTL